MPTPNSYLTRAQIIRLGLQQGGNPALANTPSDGGTPLAVVFFNTLLLHIYNTKDLPSQETAVAVSTGTPAYKISLAALSRYRALSLLRLNGRSAPLQQIPFRDLYIKVQADLDTTINATTPTGTPSLFAVEPDKSNIWLHPIPDKAYSGNLLYYAVPDVSSWGDSTVIEFDNQALINAVAMFARDYDKDTLVNLSMAAYKAMEGGFFAEIEDAGRAQGPMQMVPSTRCFNYQRNRG